MRKRIVSTLLVLCLVLMLLPGTAGAADTPTSGKCGDNVTWSYNNGVLTIEGTGKMEDYSHYGVYSPWFDYCEQIHTVNILNGVTHIGEMTFYSCSKLVNVAIPNSVTSIEARAFALCTSLTSVTIPASVTSIDGRAFDGDTKLVSINVASGNPIYTSIDGVLFDTKQAALIAYPAGKHGTYHIPDFVTAIGDYAFYNCIWLNHVTIPNGVINIGDHSFGWCPKLVSATIPLSVTNIEKSAFFHCPQLTDVYYGGTNAQWEEINIGDRNDPLFNATIHYNSTGPDQPEPSQSYDLKYDLNGGTGDVPGDMCVDSGTKLNLATTTPVREGYTFAGWSDGSTTYQPGTEFVMPNHDVTFTAQWTKEAEPAPTYTVSYSLGAVPIEAEIKGTIPEPKSYAPGETVTVTSADIILSGEKFTGWVDGTNFYAPGSTFVMPEHDVHLSAKFEPDTATIAQQFVNVALAQHGKNSAQLGLGSDWCDKFVGWCSAQLGWGNIIKTGGSNGKVRYNNIIGAGGSGVRFYNNKSDMSGGQYLDRASYTPEIGDIVIFTWNYYFSNGYQIPTAYGNYLSHVGIVYAVDDAKIYVVHGNFNDFRDNVGTGYRVCKSPWDRTSPEIYAYAKPNWAAVGNAVHGTKTTVYNCPVEVSYSYNGETLDSATGQLNANFGTMVVDETEGIVVTLNDYYDADVTITGTGIGTMNITSTFTNTDGTTRIRKFQNVPITEDTVGKLISNGSSASEILELYKNYGNTFVEAWSAYDDKTVSAADADLTDWYINGDPIYNEGLPPTPSYPDVPWTPSTPSRPTTPTKPSTPSTTTPVTPPAETKPEDTAPETPPSTPAVTLPFTDVSPADWFYPSVQYVYEKGLMTGDGSTTIFNPSGSMTRAMVWTVLGRMDGADVSGSGSAWFAKAQAWAVAEGVSDGSNPNGGVTRQELVTMLWRSAGSPAAAADLSGFSDGGDVAGWAGTAMQWAVSNAVLSGDNGALKPAAPASRAEVAAILTRFCQYRAA